jgi:regulation of enolase protein 1 (concanavalin A-like superfamily)
MLASSLTIAGHSDWAGLRIADNIHEIWFRLQRVGDDYILFYSLDGQIYEKIRTAYLKGLEEVKVGAYIASPNEADFSAELQYIKLGL